MKKNLLEARMKEFGDLGETLAQALNMTPTTFSRKKNGIADFTQSEIMQIKLRYNLTAEDVERIFFTNELP